MILPHVLYSLLGLIVGSFLNVCIYRIPRGESIVFPSSHCPTCGSAIRPYDNVPVLAYLWLQGKCRSCSSPISFQYPVVELLSALCFLACALKWEFAPATYVDSLFLCVILVLVFIDLQHQILPNVLTLPGTVVGVLLSPFQARAMFFDGLTLSLTSTLLPGNPQILLPFAGSLLGALIGGGILFLVGFGYQILRKRQGLGMGDVKMMAFVGAFLGWRLALLTIFAGSLLGSIIGICLILFRGKSLQTKLAFGVFLGVGAALTLFYGISFFQWYTSVP